VVDLVELIGRCVIWDIMVKVRDSQYGYDILDGLKVIMGECVVNISDRIFFMYFGGKIEINNFFCFLGFFWGFFDLWVCIVNDEMKIVVVHVIVSCVVKVELGLEYIILSVFNKKVVFVVVCDVVCVVYKMGVVRRWLYSDLFVWL